MRKPIGQLFLSLVLSIIGSLVLMFLLPSFGMEPEVGSETEAGVLIAIVIVVVLFSQGALQSVIANRRFESVPTGPREEGTVKWFNSTKGFGFITREDGEDVFVHYRSIRGRNRYLLREGATVSYVLGRSGKGPQAEDVDLVE
ncbi:MAG: cold-shock protein [Gammaproteobacteria bacterium]|nr:cold-shock protein [Gammaproteobacteria bacterium]